MASGGEISAVSGVAQAAGLQAGDCLLSANGHPLRDVIDWRFYADGRAVTVRVRRGAEAWTVRLRRPAGADWGVDFAQPLFDGLRRCANRCLFCFMDQLPPGWRRTLYLRDDDYRLSFLYGNFVTLTNLRPEDWARLAEQRLSPLYVSVHTTDPVLRDRLLGRQRAPDIREQIERLGRLRIAVHAQVVLCPGINDGPHLERTLADLRQLYPTIQSLSLVPVGLTRFREPPAGPGGDAAGGEGAPPLRPYTPAEARALLAWARPRQRAFRRELDCGLLYPADEFYLLAGQPVPAAGRYDGFPQLENGVGLVRLLLDDWARTRRRISQKFGPIRLRALFSTAKSAKDAKERKGSNKSAPENQENLCALCDLCGSIFSETGVPDARAKKAKLYGPGGRGEARRRITLATGTLIAPVLRKLAAELAARMPGLEIEVLPIENVTLGPTVTVAGLLTGEALLAGLRAARGDLLFLPAAAFDEQGRTLDDVTVLDLEQELGRPIALVDRMSQVIRSLAGGSAPWSLT